MGGQMMQQPIPSPQQGGGGPQPPPPPHPGISQSPMSHNSPMGGGNGGGGGGAGGGGTTPNHPSPMHPGPPNGAPMRSPMHRSATPVSSHGGHTPSHAPKTADEFNLDFLDGIDNGGGDRSQHNATPSQRSGNTPGPVPPGASPAPHTAVPAGGGPASAQAAGGHQQQDEFSHLF